MTFERQRSLARAGAVLTAVVVAACAVILVADYAAARARAAGDAARVAELQAQAQTDAPTARVLAAEQDRITRARRARKARGDALGVVLIAASAAFIATAKWRVALGRRRPAPLTLVRLERFPQRGSGRPQPARESPPEGGHHARTSTARTAVTVQPAPDAIDLACVDGIIRTHGTSTEAAIPILQAIQTHYRYLPDEALRRVCELTDITPAQIAGTSSFYARFRRSPVGEHVVRVCHGTACHVSGARQITEELRRHLRIPDGTDTDPDRLFTIDEVACLGCCSLAPVLTVDEHTAGRLTPATASAALDVVRCREQPA